MALKILVCAKQVPDTDKVKIDFKTGNLKRESVKGVFNKDCLIALNEALLLKKKYEDVHVTVLTMGPLEAEDIAFEAIARGADKAVLLSDKSFKGADTWATSETLKTAVLKLGEFDMVLTGKASSDGDTSQVGSQLAQKLNIPHLAYVKEVQISSDLKKAYVKREIDEGIEEDEIVLPALFTCQSDASENQYIKMNGIFKEKDITIWNGDDLGIDPSQTGLNGSKTLVLGTYAISPKTPGFMVQGKSEKEKCENILEKLKDKKYI